MSAIDVVAIPSAVHYVTFDSLNLGRSSQQVVGRLLRFWDAKNVKKDGEFLGIVLLLLDEKNSVIHGFIPSNRANDYRPLLQEGVIFHLTGFEIARCSKLYKITDHPFVIRFLPATNIVRIDNVATAIAPKKFMLRKLDHLQALANTNLELPDVVGQIRYVQGSNLMDPTSTQRLVLRFLMDSSATVNLSLWNDAAATFRGHLASGNTKDSVMLVTTVNPKVFGGNLYLNSTAATRFFFDTNIEAIKDFMTSCNIETATPFARADTAEGIQKKETLTINELYRYISQTSETTQEADFLIKASIVGVLQRNGWSYVSCAGCSRKLDTFGNSLRCNKCVGRNVTGVLRYRVEVAVHDGAHGATFVVFDSAMTKLTSKPASSLTLEGHGGDGTDLPECLKALSGKQFLFQVKVTPFNFTPNHRTFTVSKMTAIPSQADEQEGEINNDGNPPPPDSPAARKLWITEPAVKDKPSTSGTTADASSRKRCRE